MNNRLQQSLKSTGADCSSAEHLKVFCTGTFLLVPADNYWCRFLAVQK